VKDSKNTWSWDSAALSRGGTELSSETQDSYRRWFLADMEMKVCLCLSLSSWVTVAEEFVSAALAVAAGREHSTGCFS